ncbi:MAG: hypothetical protein M1815_004129 [Lichina confinis]|nr:MAG: hypothetical protein M1815_004129 [Lichina confinis]
MEPRQTPPAAERAATAAPPWRHSPRARPSTALKVRSVILTASAVAITVLGSIYGAGLKMSRDAKREKQTGEQARCVIDEQIAQLERKKGLLVAHRVGLAQKADNFRHKVDEKKRNSQQE